MSRFDQSRAYETLLRLPILTWSAALAVLSLANLEQYVCRVNPAVAASVYAVNVAMRLSVTAYLTMIATTAFARTRVIGSARGVEPRISAVVGTFLATILLLFPRRELPPSEGVISTLLILAGNTLAASVVYELRLSFSIMPEARKLITSGPYRLIRHPLYLAETLATIGALLQFFSGWTLGLIAIQLAFQLRRMQNEERVLIEHFPGYRAYLNKTARIIPGVF